MIYIYNMRPILFLGLPIVKDDLYYKYFDGHIDASSSSLLEIRVRGGMEPGPTIPH